MLKKLRNWTYQHAISSAVLIALLFYLMMKGVSVIFSLLPNSTAVSYLQQIVGILYPIGIMIFFGFANAFKSKKFFKGLLCSMALTVLQAFVLVVFFAESLSDPATVWKPWNLILFGLISVVGIGIREECVFRATIQNILAKKYANSAKGIWITAIVSALIFGLIHAFNVFSGVDLLPAVVQAFTNVGIGLFFAALYLRSGNLWVLIFVHTLTDTAGLAGSVFLYQSDIAVISSMSWQSLIGGLIFLGISCFLLRPSKCKEILARFRAEEAETTAPNAPVA